MHHSMFECDSRRKHEANTETRMRMKASRTVIFVVFTLLVVSIVPFLFPHARAQAVAAPGYSVDDFATGLKYGTGGYIPNVGPLGLASDPLGNLYVADIASCNVFKFNHGLGQVASDANVFVKTSTLSPLCPHGLTFGRDGNLYLNLIDLVNGPGAADGEVVQIGLTPGPTLGTIIRVVASGLHWPSGLASDPLSGDLFVSDSAGVSPADAILRISPVSGLVITYAQFSSADGLAFGSDGTLYAVVGGASSDPVKISGTDQPQPPTVTPLPNALCPDGLAISLDPTTPFLYTNNSCNGSITKIDLSSSTSTDIVTGGSRGDFVTVGSDDCLYATQTDRVLRVSNGDRSCRPPPLGPLFQHHPSITNAVFNSDPSPIPAGSSVPRGSSVYDTAQVPEVSGIVPTGNVTYTFFNNNACSGSGTLEKVALSSGLVRNSTAQPSLAIGSYSFQANYTGDNNYFPSTSSCENFSAALVTTELFNSNSVVVPLGGFVPNGTLIHDTATVTGLNAITPTGTLTYVFFSNGACSGSGTSQTVNLTQGVAPNSTVKGPLAVGFYSFNATYSGDSNYPRSTSQCEFFIAGSSSFTTAVFTSTGVAVPVGGSVPFDSSVHDTAIVTGVGGFTPSGTVTYMFFMNTGNNICSGSTHQQSVTLSNGMIPNSNTQGPLTAGNYSYQASYSGDNNYPPSTSSCEPFTVAPHPVLTTALFTSTGASIPLGSSVYSGTSVYDTASLSGVVSGFTPTGTVTYTFYTSSSCGGPGTPQTLPLSNGLIPNSPSQGPLMAGSYSFRASYNGDSNYISTNGSCESFTVLSPFVSTALFTSDGISIPLGSSVSLGTSVYDTAVENGVIGSFTPTGTVTYTFSTSSSCGGSGTTQTVTLSNGLVPNSALHGPLAIGTYSFRASYSGDGNYPSSTSSCESFSVIKASAVLSTALFASGGVAVPVGSSVLSGTSIHDTAVLNGIVSTTPPTGTVTYRLYTSGSCSGSATSQMVTLSNGLIPNSTPTNPLMAGNYGYQASYSGDSNYFSATSQCEPFTVLPPFVATALYTSTSVSIPVGSSVSLGTPVHDTAGEMGTINGFTPTGTVTYTFFTNGLCSGSGTSQTVTLMNGLITNSTGTGPLAGGSYSFRASYSGDGNYPSSTSSCENFMVSQALTTLSTTLFISNGGSVPVGGSVTIGNTVYDTASLTGMVGGFTPTATVTYTFYTNNGCARSGTPQTVTLSNGQIPNSPTQGSLSGFAAFSYQATYSGDNNYTSSTSPCEYFTVSTGTVGGSLVPIDKLALLAPYLGLASALIVVTTLCTIGLKQRKRKTP